MEHAQHGEGFRSQPEHHPPLWRAFTLPHRSDLLSADPLFVEGPGHCRPLSQPPNALSSVSTRRPGAGARADAACRCAQARWNAGMPLPSPGHLLAALDVATGESSATATPASLDRFRKFLGTIRPVCRDLRSICHGQLAHTRPPSSTLAGEATATISTSPPGIHANRRRFFASSPTSNYGAAFCSTELERAIAAT